MDYEDMLEVSGFLAVHTAGICCLWLIHLTRCSASVNITPGGLEPTFVSDPCSSSCWPYKPFASSWGESFKQEQERGLIGIQWFCSDLTLLYLGRRSMPMSSSTAPWSRWRAPKRLSVG
eukprot:1146288-Pelagomonas_calceolata.AAC.4